MKSLKHILPCLALAIACNHAGKNAPPQERGVDEKLNQKTQLQKVYLDEVPNLRTAASDHPTKIQISGNLPNPSYKLDHIDVQVRGEVIEITPLAQHDPSVMAIQVLVPFTDSVEVGPLKSGEYKLRLVGRSGVQETRLEVK